MELAGILTYIGFALITVGYAVVKMVYARQDKQEG